MPISLKQLSPYLLSLTFVLPACSDKQETADSSSQTVNDAAPLKAEQPQKESSTETPAAALFAYIPEKTSYVMAMLEPVPAELLGLQLEIGRTTIRQLAERIRAENNSKDNGQNNQAAADLFVEVADNLHPDRLHELGLTADVLWGLYTTDLYPVMRGRISDGNKLRNLIDRFASNRSANSRGCGGITNTHIASTNDVEAFSLFDFNEINARFYCIYCLLMCHSRSPGHVLGSRINHPAG